MLSLHLHVVQVLTEYHIRTTIHEADPYTMRSGVIMTRDDARGPLVEPTEDELSTLLTVTSDWLNELRSGHPNG